MPTHHKLSLASAILININIMLGSGIFINTVILAQLAGSLGALVYAIVGILLLPLILAITQLLRCSVNGGGTFYDFGITLNPTIGFLSSWSYFIGKMASSALGIHVCFTLLQEILPALKIVPIMLLDCSTIILFACLNLLNLKIGQSIQTGFMILKFIPITFAIFSGLFIFSGAHFTPATLLWTGIPTSIPLVLYAFSGFEASCSLSRSIIDPEKNAPRAILISYALVIIIVMLYQSIFFGNLGMALAQLPDYREAFPTLLHALLPASIIVKNWLISILHIGIAASSLGAAYGIMYSNSWNLFTIAHNKSIIGTSVLTKLNKHHMPFICVMIEGLLALVYILMSQGNQVALQQVSAFGSVIAYSCSALALLIITYRASKSVQALPVLSILSCILLIGAFIWSLAMKGITLLFVIFLAIIAGGVTLLAKNEQLPD
jgi:amino acid transporter